RRRETAIRSVSAARASWYCRQRRRRGCSGAALDSAERGTPRALMEESIQHAIVRQVLSWPGVTSGRHRFGGVELRYGRRELGHVHGNRLVDLPFPLLIRDAL